MEDNSYSQLIEESIKLHFERNGTLDEMRSGLHAKVLKMLHEQQKLRKNEPLCGADLEQRGLSHLLNQLILEYFEWFGYKHTLETFSLETGLKSRKSRDKLRHELKATFEHKELPVLMELLMQQTRREEGKKSEEDQHQKVVNKPEKNSNILKKVQGPNLKTPRLPPRDNKNAPAETMIKVNKFHGPDATINNGTKVQAKVHVRQRMSEAERKVQTKPKLITKKSLGNPKSIYDTDSATDSTKSTTEEEYNDTESSETFADIPNRYYYREQEPPEKSYPQGYGEEGPYEGPHQKITKRKVEKSKMIKITEMDTKEKKPKGSGKNTPQKAYKPKVPELSNSSKRSKCSYHPHRRLNHSQDDLNLPVSKPKCPETVISSIKMDSGDESGDDSDVYL